MSSPQLVAQARARASEPTIQPAPPDASRNDPSGPHWLLWLLAVPLRLFVFLYQKLVSPLLPPACRYHPSCSSYAAESLRLHGAARGSLLAVWRLLRCHPWARGGLDPVPPA